MVKIFLLLVSFSLMADEPFLRLDLSVDGENPFYPKQKLHFVYKISYRGEVQLTKETLPLLEAEGFKKVGTVSVTEEKKEDYSIQVISQEVKAGFAGSYHFPASTIEGFLNGDKNRIIKSTIPPYTVVIEPFPKKNQPLSFSGAMGRFMIETALLTPSTVSINDNIRLKITLQGEGDFSTVQLPIFICQPGYSGFFTFSDLPPQIKQEEDKKIFIVEMRPLTAVITEIPALEFSSFDPEARTYYTVTAPPIPLQVKEDFFLSEPLPKENIRWDEVLTVAAPASFSTVQFSIPWFHMNPWWLLLTPFIVLFASWIHQQYQEGVSSPSREWLKEIQNAQQGSDSFYYLVQLALQERGDQEFTEKIQEGRYGKGELPSPSSCIERIKKWY